MNPAPASCQRCFGLAGPNLRNLMLHGFIGDPGPGATAVLLHAALSVAPLKPNTTQSADEA